MSVVIFCEVMKNAIFFVIYSVIVYKIQDYKECLPQLKCKSKVNAQNDCLNIVLVLKTKYDFCYVYDNNIYRKCTS